MNKIILLFFLTLFSISCISKEDIGSKKNIRKTGDIFIGIHGTFTNSWIMNMQVLNSKDEMKLSSSMGGYFGVVGEYFIKNNISIKLDINYNIVRQNYTGNILFVEFEKSKNRYKAHTYLHGVDLPVLIKLGSPCYFEFGPLFQFLLKANYSRMFAQETNGINALMGSYNDAEYHFTNISDKDIKDKFNKFGMGVSLGFGCNIPVFSKLFPDKFILNAGLRFNYIFTDISGVNALGQDIKEQSIYLTENDIKKFKNKPLYIGIRLGISYKIKSGTVSI